MPRGQPQGNRTEGSNPSLSASGCPNSQVLGSFAASAPAVFPIAVLARSARLGKTARRSDSLIERFANAREG
jgi:hypothetical protein